MDGGKVMVENKLTEKQEKFIDKFYFVTEKYLFPKTKGKYFLKGSIGATILFFIVGFFSVFRSFGGYQKQIQESKELQHYFQMLTHSPLYFVMWIALFLLAFIIGYIGLTLAHILIDWVRGNLLK